jgi:hypothetical protein
MSVVAAVSNQQVSGFGFRVSEKDEIMRNLIISNVIGFVILTPETRLGGCSRPRPNGFSRNDGIEERRFYS